MKKYLIAIVVAAISALFMQSAAAENCQFHKIKFLLDTFEELDPPLPGFEFCGTGRLVGTINGQVTTCVNFADLVPSDGIWGDDDFQFFAIKFFDVFETKKGTLDVIERGIIGFDTQFLGVDDVQSTMSYITGGTGIYEGATGLLTMGPKWPKRLDVQLFEGKICGPNIRRKHDDDDD